MRFFKRGRRFLTPDTEEANQQDSATQAGEHAHPVSKSDSSVEKQQVDTELLSFAEFVRARTRSETLVARVDCRAEPLQLSEEAFDGLMERLKECRDAQFSDIESLQGQGDLYFYSTLYMSGSFARIQARLRDKDIKVTIAESVREESRIYPRPALRSQFLSEPFWLSEEEIDQALEELRTSEEYCDIHPCVTSDGTRYLYSDKYLTEAHALSLVDTRNLFDEE